MWRVKVLVFAPAELDPGGQHPLECTSSIAVCDEHRKEARVEDFLTDDFREIAAAVLKDSQKAAPDFALSRLAFDLLSAGDA
jgi:hypothetical protein